MARDIAAEIRKLAEERILVLDGAWGVLLQGRGLSEYLVECCQARLECRDAPSLLIKDGSRLEVA